MEHLEQTPQKSHRQQAVSQLVDQAFTQGKSRRQQVPEEVYRRSLALTHSTLGQIQKCGEILSHPSDTFGVKNEILRQESLPQYATVACQGVPGAYSHIASQRLFSSPELQFYPAFEQVALAVQTGEAQYGILPFENSSVGTVADITEQLYRHNAYINTVVPIRISHCLCTAPKTTLAQVQQVLSHPQALQQCQQTLRTLGLQPVERANTAMAAQEVSESTQPLACLCSKKSAELYGLTIQRENMQDTVENYTRFVCIAPQAVVLPGADSISVAVSFPNQSGALAEFLTQFMIFNLDLTRIQSLPIAGPEFSVRFHLDFTGTINDPSVYNLLGHMYHRYEDFKFLGNYRSLE